MSEPPLEVTDGGAFVRRLDLAPTGSGPLDGLSFAVKDLIDVGGVTTGGGNPTWLATHPPATVDAVCVDLLRAAGARCAGRTVTDELAFSLLGENFFYGTPLNPRAPDQVPGGSSSGSASAVAQGLADLALGTDTGGSVRVPAANCGLWGFRPSHGAVSVAGVLPFAPGFDTVGILAREASVLARAGAALLGAPLAGGRPGTVHLVTDAFALADPEVGEALAPGVAALRERWGDGVRATRLEELVGPLSFDVLLDAFTVLEWAEVESTLGAWTAAHEPPMGPEAGANFRRIRELDRRRIEPAVAVREEFANRLGETLGPDDLLCLPTAASPAPRRGSVGPRDTAAAADYYPRTLSLTALAGLGRLPQVSLPGGEAAGVPVGLSLAARRGRDGFLLELTAQVG